MSSLRNAVQRPNHKERAQPRGREKLGILEKHGDYKLRARNHSEKKRQLRLLRQKAANRNPDEFHFGMISSSTDKAGRRASRNLNSTMPVSTVKRLKAQDAGYLRSINAKARKDLHKLQNDLIVTRSMQLRNLPVSGADTIYRSHKTIFVQNQDAQDLCTLNMQSEIESVKSKGVRKSTTIPSHSETRLKALREREQQLSTAEDSLNAERARMSHSSSASDRSGVKYRPRQRNK